ncbi:MAG: transglutaminase domain-containing protein [Bacteroidetes bacterium]|nr:transglutaminase domain-containing protein [Bacteroidota bacterium]
MKYALAFTLLLAVLLIGCQQNDSASQSGPKPPPLSTDQASIADIEREIRQHIRNVEERDGYFGIETDSQSLNLKLVRVHTEYLSILGPNEFFACVDLATKDGDVYDVDFFLKGTKSNMDVGQKSLHKLNGKPFYTWKQTKDGAWTKVPVKRASPDLLGVKEGIDSFQFTYRIVLPDWNGTADIWVPIAGSDEFQKVSDSEMEIPFDFEQKKEEKYGNNYLYATVDEKYAGDTLRMHYNIVRKEKSTYAGTQLEARRYLGPTPFLPVGGRFLDLANDIIEKKKARTDLEKARALYDYISDSLRYAKEGTYGTADAQYACDAKSGNCTEFHSLFISLARSLSIPARFAVGAAIPTERNDGGVNGYHCWAEFYADGMWWPIDISEANKYAALSTYYFGHHPANRIELSKGRQIALDPLPNAGPVRFFAYPIIEQNGSEIFGQTFFDFQRL